uniref:Uncharacterized protein n=1 Tax=Setaria viridis TaxID=4556 RepID=A0A4U6VXH8_SETVI|nr:hypothetical protein SEVIR_2G247000v2 [Setaria viridis]
MHAPQADSQAQSGAFNGGTGAQPSRERPGQRAAPTRPRKATRERPRQGGAGGAARLVWCTGGRLRRLAQTAPYRARCCHCHWRPANGKAAGPAAPTGYSVSLDRVMMGTRLPPGRALFPCSLRKVLGTSVQTSDDARDGVRCHFVTMPVARDTNSLLVPLAS